MESFKNVTMKELEEADYTDNKSGKIVKFNKYDHQQFRMFFQFKCYFIFIILYDDGILYL